LLVPHCGVRGDTVSVLELRITGNLVMSRGARTCFGGFNQRPPDAMSPQCRFDVPALDEWYRGRTATRRVLAVVQFEESDESPFGFCHENDGGFGRILEVLPRLGVMIGQGTWPQGIAQTNPFGAVALNNLSDLQRRYRLLREVVELVNL
jgi:hypothetical protein